MFVKRLILLLFALAWVVPAGARTPAPAEAELSVRPAVERPQWVDLGMCDVLAAPSGTSLTPPTTVRVVHNNPTGTHPSASERHPLYGRGMACPLARPVGTRSGYIYMLRCLRL